MKLERANTITSCFMIFCWLTCISVAWGADDGQTPNEAPTTSTQTAPEEVRTKPAPETTAERIVRLQRTTKENTELLAELKDKLADFDDPDGNFAELKNEFDKLDQQLQDKKKDLEAAEGDAKKPIQKQIEELKPNWQLARDRFNVALQEKKTLPEQIATLGQKIEEDKKALQKLLEPEAPTSQPASSPQSTQPAAAPAATKTSTDDAPAEKPTLPTPMSIMTGTPSAQPNDTDKDSSEPPPDKETIEARKKVEEATTEVERKQAIVDDLEHRLAALQKNIESTQEALNTAREKVRVERQAERILNDQYQKQIADGAAADKLQQTWADIKDARTRYTKAQEQVNELVGRISEWQQEKNQLQSELFNAKNELEQAKKEADQAAKVLKQFTNPFSLQNLWKWALEHGPRLLGIIIISIILLRLIPFVDRRIMHVIVGKADRGTRVERENRAKTLVSVFHNAAAVTIYVTAILMLLDELNVPIAALMGGVAVVGLAVAFGAQNLIRDFFYGFMILLENQYGINDVVKINGLAGLVERITLRVTVLRDLEGVAHFIPNGEITSVSNMTHGWSRVALNIGVSYNEDVEEVMRVLMEIATELYNDPEYAHLILDPPEMLGVDDFADSAVIIKMLIKTRVLQQWTIKRAMLYRIKKRFDALGIEIPYPHRTNYHRVEKETLDLLRLYKEDKNAQSGD